MRRKKYAASEIKKIVRRANIRSYSYVAYVVKANGRLLKIKAGCRTWYSFGEAREHYDGRHGMNTIFSTTSPRWSDAWLMPRPEWSAHRDEARAIIDKLQADVEAYVRKCKKAKR
jgi:hypothetical protein